MLQETLRTLETAPEAMREFRKRLALTVAETMKPPPRLTLSQWADAKRVLSSEVAAIPGRWQTSRAEYLRGIMDACSDPEVEEVDLMCSAQVGKTSCVENLIGYYIDQDPSTILLVEPTLEKAEEFSKERLAPMLRDTPCLQGKVRDARTRDSNNTLLSKVFPGGHLAMAGANSPAGLASRPRRVVLCDEVDRYLASAGTEGDPVLLARKRTTTFRRRKKIFLISSPGTAGVSRIEKAYEASDKRRYFVPCPHCEEMQVLRWAQVKWEKDAPETAAYFCEACKEPWTDSERWAAVRLGEWRAEKPFDKIAGFHLNEIYSPWVTLAEMAAAWLAAQTDREALKVFINTALAETFDEDEEEGEELPWVEIRDRANSDANESRYELGAKEIPAGVFMIYAAVDTQDDRFAPLVYGFGRGEEAWLLYEGEIPGDPMFDETQTALDDLLSKTWRHPSGVDLPILGAAIDSRGHRTQTVYNYVRKRGQTKIIAIAGATRPGLPIIAGKPTPQDVAYGGKIIPNGVMLWHVGTDTAKGEIYARLKLEKGPRAIHFPSNVSDEFYKQLTSEKLVTKFKAGVPYKTWVLPSGKRNEVLDSTVYCFAAAIRGGIQRKNWDEVEAAFAVRATQPQAVAVSPGPPKDLSPALRSNWMQR